MFGANALSRLVIFSALASAGIVCAQSPPRFLDQNWSDDVRRQFWFIDQGSRLIPLKWFQALERPASLEKFACHLDRFGLVTDRFDDASPYGLPIGFSVGIHKDIGLGIQPDGVPWVGITCAACHSEKIQYGDVSYFIEGAPSMVDFDGFMDELSAALDATSIDKAKWLRFVGAVGDTSGFDALQEKLHHRQKVDHPDTRAGLGRLDAFGQIFNEVAVFILGSESDAAAPNAPVSYPCLWDIAQHKYVQWNGSAPNLGVGGKADGSALRNIGEVIGVFGEIKVGDEKTKYPSSANLCALRQIEQWISQLRSPGWPVLFPPVDQTAAANGQTLYREHCSGCHAVIDSRSPPRRTPVQMTSVDVVETDRGMIDNFRLRSSDTGPLKGKRTPTLRSPFSLTSVGKRDYLHTLTGRIAIGAIRELEPNFLSKNAVGLLLHGNPKLTNYKARPLNGIWATAPYLHNGSVPNLWELLKAPETRVKQFCIGNGEYDPVHVGFQTYEGASPCPDRTFRFDTRFSGNSNGGHAYGVDLTTAQKKQLIEYLKTL